MKYKKKKKKCISKKNTTALYFKWEVLQWGWGWEDTYTSEAIEIPIEESQFHSWDIELRKF